MMRIMDNPMHIKLHVTKVVWKFVALAQAF